MSAFDPVETLRNAHDLLAEISDRYDGSPAPMELYRSIKPSERLLLEAAGLLKTSEYNLGHHWSWHSQLEKLISKHVAATERREWLNANGDTDAANEARLTAQKKLKDFDSQVSNIDVDGATEEEMAVLTKVKTRRSQLDFALRAAGARVAEIESHRKALRTQHAPELVRWHADQLDDTAKEAFWQSYESSTEIVPSNIYTTL